MRFFQQFDPGKVSTTSGGDVSLLPEGIQLVTLHGSGSIYLAAAGHADPCIHLAMGRQPKIGYGFLSTAIQVDSGIHSIPIQAFFKLNFTARKLRMQMDKFP